MAKFHIELDDGDGLITTRTVTKFYNPEIGFMDEPTWRILLYEFKQFLDGFGFVFDEETENSFEALIYGNDKCIADGKTKCFDGNDQHKGLDEPKKHEEVEDMEYYKQVLKKLKDDLNEIRKQPKWNYNSNNKNDDAYVNLMNMFKPKVSNSNLE